MVSTAAQCGYSFRVAVAAALLVLGVLLSGCGGGLPSVDTRQLKISASVDANSDAPVAVDLVFAMDEDALAAVANLAAAEWFRDKSQIRLALPTGLQVQSFELAPQRSLDYKLTGAEKDAVGAFVFAAYSTPGTHRARIDRLENPVVRLGRRAFAVEAGQ